MAAAGPAKTQAADSSVCLNFFNSQSNINFGLWDANVW